MHRYDQSLRYAGAKRISNDSRGDVLVMRLVLGSAQS